MKIHRNTNDKLYGYSKPLRCFKNKRYDTKIVFAGSSEEYGLVISSEEHYKNAKKEYGTIFPEPVKIPEVPIAETNPLRPMSPYAVSKVYGDHLMQKLLSLLWFKHSGITELLIMKVREGD